MSTHDFETIRYETSPDRVATITLDRPEVLNAFDRRMCEEMRTAWRLVKDDAAVNAVVLRAAGDRAFSTGLDIKKPYGQPDDVWNHEDPGELLSPKWQKVWKTVVCAVQGLWTAARYKIPVVFVICNNAQYQILKVCGRTMNLPEAKQGKYESLDLVGPEIDYVGLARSLGVEAHRISEPDQLCDAVQAGWKGNRPLLIDVPISRGTQSRLNYG